MNREVAINVQSQRTDATALPFILAAEAAAREQGFISGWGEDRHRREFAAPDTAYFLVSATHARQRTVGFAIVRGLKPEPVSIELKRLVITETGCGYGRAWLRWFKAFAFAQLDAHRAWLDVFADNRRARNLYASEGFVEEGVMRECARRNGEYVSLVLMSLLAREYRGG
jgi:L-amino acid N-acyltransferase YncA